MYYYDAVSDLSIKKRRIETSDTNKASSAA